MVTKVGARCPKCFIYKDDVATVTPTLKKTVPSLRDLPPSLSVGFLIKPRGYQSSISQPEVPMSIYYPYFSIDFVRILLGVYEGTTRLIRRQYPWIYKQGREA